MWVYIQTLFRTSSLLVLLHWLHLKNYCERTSVNWSKFSADEWITHADLHAVLSLLCLVFTLIGLGDLVKYLHTVLKPWVKLQMSSHTWKSANANGRTSVEQVLSVQWAVSGPNTHQNFWHLQNSTKLFLSSIVFVLLRVVEKAMFWTSYKGAIMLPQIWVS